MVAVVGVYHRGEVAVIRVTIVREGEEPEVHAFKQRQIAIGRADGNDVVLVDGRVAGTHARVVASGDAITLVDVGSGHGTRVGGEVVRGPVALAPGDAVGISVFTLYFAPLAEDVDAGPLPARAELLRHEAAAYLGPIAGAAADPGGDERYARLAAEMERDTALLEAPVRWPRVAEVGGELLREVGKDLRVAAYVALALYRSRGVDGLAIGLLVVDGLLERCWDDLLPPRRRGRVLALEWLYERLTAAVRDDQPRLVDVDGWRVVRATSERLGERVRARFGEPSSASAAWSAELGRIRRATAALLEAAGTGGKLRVEPSAAPDGRGPAAPSGRVEAVAMEARHLEVALQRDLVEGVGVPLHVLIRAPGTRPLLERLGDGAAPAAQDGERGEAWVDFQLDPRGRPVALDAVVTLQGDDLRCADPRKRVRLCRGRDAPLLTFFVAPRRAGPVGLVVEVAIAGEVVGEEHVARVCRGRDAAGAGAGLGCQSGLLRRARARASAWEPAAEHLLHELLTGLFTQDELSRWVRLHFAAWSAELPHGAGSLNELAFAVIDAGAGRGGLGGEFFAALASQFPDRGGWIAAVRGRFA